MLPVENNFSSQNSWTQEYREAIKSIDEVNSFFKLNIPNHFKYQIFIPRKLANKILKFGIDSPLGKQFLPSLDELSEQGILDPIGDKIHAQNDGIIHRYANRILFTPTTNCPVICRYCFRKNELNEQDKIFQHKLSALKTYLLKHQDINEVILTGGDPLILNDQKISEILATLVDCNIKFVRFHTRTPVILPSRLTHQFIEMLDNFSKQFTKILFCLHTNHPQELSNDVAQALEKLRGCKIDKRTQTVLLNGVNDNAETLLKLFYQVIDHDFNPYYLHHPDQVRGGMHFYLPLERGRKIYNQLRNNLPGWAIPHYVIDNSQGRGKQFAFNPESFHYSGKLLDKSGSLTPY